jgi:hypothetical protein
MLKQCPQHADRPTPDRQGGGVPEEDLCRSFKAKGTERVDRIHAKSHHGII